MPQTHVVEGDMVVTGSLVASKIVYASDSIITLPPATVPLTGGEYVAMYQNGQIVKYPVGAIDYPDNAGSIKYFPFGASVGAGGGAPTPTRLRVSGTEGAVGTGAAAVIELTNGTNFSHIAHGSAVGGGDLILRNNLKVSLANIAGTVYAVFAADKSVAFGNGTINTYGQHIWNANGAGTGGIATIDYDYTFNPALSGTGFRLQDQYGSRLVLNRPTANTVPGKITNAYGAWIFNGSLTIPSGGSLTIANGATTAFNGVVIAAAGMTVGAGAAVPSAGTRLRIDQTNVGTAVIEFYNGTKLTYFTMDTAANSNLFACYSDDGFIVRTAAGVARHLFNGDGSLSFSNGQFVINTAGASRAKNGLSVGGGFGLPGSGSRLRVDQTDGQPGGAISEWYNGIATSYFYLSTGAAGKFILDTPGGLTIQNGGVIALNLSTGATAQIGFLGAAAIARPTASGSWAGNAAGQSLAAALASLGLIVNSTTA